MPNSSSMLALLSSRPASAANSYSVSPSPSLGAPKLRRDPPPYSRRSSLLILPAGFLSGSVYDLSRASISLRLCRKSLPRMRTRAEEMPGCSSQTRLATGVLNESERPSGFFCRLLKAATSDAQGIRLHHQILNPTICYPLQCVNWEPVGPIAQWLEQA